MSRFPISKCITVFDLVVICWTWIDGKIVCNWARWAASYGIRTARWVVGQKDLWLIDPMDQADVLITDPKSNPRAGELLVS